MDLHTKSLDVVGAVRSSSEIRKVELDLVPTLIETHRHGADERLHSSCGLYKVRM